MAFPSRVYTDNGKDFDSWALTGETKAMRWKRRRHPRRARPEATRRASMPPSSVEHIHAWPYHGQSKPIERFFGTVEGSFGKSFSTYTGRNPQEKPEQLPAMLAKGQAPTLSEFVEKFATWVEVSYHQQIHTGDAMDCRPCDAWETNLRTKRTAETETLELLLQRRVGPLKVGQNGIVNKGIWYGQYDLAHWFGRDVYITIDPATAGRVNVYTDDGRFLCIARANLRVAANATPDMLSTVIAEQRRENERIRGATRMIAEGTDAKDVTPSRSRGRRRRRDVPPRAQDPGEGHG
jgi:hypothetical protein